MAGGKLETWFWFSIFPSAESLERWECGNPACSWRDSQGARGNGGKPALGFPRFPQTRHFHRSLQGTALVVALVSSLVVGPTLGLLILQGMFHSVTRNIEFDDDAVMHQPINGGGGHHGVLKNGFPFGKC